MSPKEKGTARISILKRRVAEKHRTWQGIKTCSHALHITQNLMQVAIEATLYRQVTSIHAF